MKTIKLILGLALGFLFASTSTAQTETQKENNTLLYSITGNGLKETSYLFGTAHVQCADDFEIKSKVLKAIKNSKEVCFEIDIADTRSNEVVMERIKNGERLSEQLDSLELIKIDSLLQVKMGMTAKMLDMYSLDFVAPLLGLSGIKCTDRKYFEKEILSIATQNNIKTRGIETIEYQMDCVKKSSNKQTILNHIYTDAFYKVLPTVLKAHKNEDLNTLMDICLGQDYMTTHEVKVLLEIRNANWVKLMPEMMKTKPTFFAFGAAHLGSKIGVIEGLRKLGYTVTPIYK